MPPRSAAASLSLAAFAFSAFVFFSRPAVSFSPPSSSHSSSPSTTTTVMPPPPPRRACAAVVPPARLAVHRYFILRHGETDCNSSGTIQGSSDISRLTARGERQAARAGAAVFGGRGHKNKDNNSDDDATPAPPPLTIHSVYVSPLTRAQQTLSVLRQHALPGQIPADATVWSELREIDLYEWEGKSASDLKVTDADAYRAWVAGDAHGFSVSGRKPVLETWERAGRLWKALRRSSSSKTTTTTTTATATRPEEAPAASASSSSPSSNSTNTLIVAHGTLGQALLCTAFGWEAATHFRRHNFPNCGLVEIVWHADRDVATSWRWHHPEPSEINRVDDASVA